LKFPSGEGWQYGSGVDWAGQVLEKVTGKSLGEYMSENLFKPLGMADTTFRRQTISERLQGRIVQCSYRNAEDGTLVVGPLPVPEDPPVESGGAGLHSTAQDYAKFLQALLAAGAGKETVLCKETIDEMFRPQINDAQYQMLKIMADRFLPIPPGTPLNHGISGVINMEDLPGKRRKGSLMWGGMSNCVWVSNNSSFLGWMDNAADAREIMTNQIPSGSIARLELLPLCL
jgi:CubicO group peptidase (beta-lactamase class C family)